MANQVGRVRFADGTTLYPVVQGSSGGVSTRLYQSAEEAYQHRDDDFVQNYPKVPEAVLDEEPVEVWEWHWSEKDQPDFMSRASKSLRLLTGPSSRDQITHDYAQSLEEQSSFGSR